MMAPEIGRIGSRVGDEDHHGRICEPLDKSARYRDSGVSIRLRMELPGSAKRGRGWTDNST